MILVFWLIMALIVAWIASNKGRSLLGWFIYGLLFWPVALIHAVLMGNKSMKCPKCLSSVDTQATVCKYCQHKFTADEIKTVTKAREQSRKKQLIAVAIIAAIFALSSYLGNEGIKSATQQSVDTSINATNLETKTGSYQSYDGITYAYEILYQDADKRYVATFTPFLPREDKTLIEGTLQVFKTTYGNDAQIDPQPTIEERVAGNVIKFRADTGNYYVLPVKEDTGEIHTLMYWKE